MERYVVYVIDCLTPKHLYVGITKNLNQRLRQHRSGRGGSFFTRKYGVAGARVVGMRPSYEEALVLENQTVRGLWQSDPHLTVVGGSWMSEKKACIERARERRLRYKLPR